MAADHPREAAQLAVGLERAQRLGVERFLKALELERESEDLGVLPGRRRRGGEPRQAADHDPSDDDPSACE